MGFYHQAERRGGCEGEERLPPGICSLLMEKELLYLKETRYIVGVTYWIAVDNRVNLIAILIMVVCLSIAAIQYSIYEY